MSEIFISHATADTALAKLIVNFLKEAVGVKDGDIFCSSITGHGVPLTADFNSYIREQIEKPHIVLALLTPSYLDSEFCLMELGAAWTKSLNTLAIVVPPVSFETVTKTLGLRQAWRINDHTKLSEVRGLFQKLNLETRSAATWEEKAAGWRRKLPAILKSLPASQTVGKASLDAVISEFDAFKVLAKADAEAANARYSFLQRENQALQAQLLEREKPLATVMIVEPEKLIALDLQILLASAGYEIIATVESSYEALRLAYEKQPDIIITETRLTDGKRAGVEFIETGGDEIDSYVFYLTAFPEDVTYLRDWSEIVTKPFRPDELTEKLATAQRLIRRTRVANGAKSKLERMRAID